MTTIYLQNTDYVLVDEGYLVGLPNEYGTILQLYYVEDVQKYKDNRY